MHRIVAMFFSFIFFFTYIDPLFAIGPLSIRYVTSIYFGCTWKQLTDSLTVGTTRSEELADRAHLRHGRAVLSYCDMCVCMYV